MIGRSRGQGHVGKWRIYTGIGGHAGSIGNEYIAGAVYLIGPV